MFMDGQGKFDAVIFNSSQDFEIKDNLSLNTTVFQGIKDQVPALNRLTAQTYFGTPQGTAYARRMSLNSGKV